MHTDHEKHFVLDLVHVYRHGHVQSKNGERVGGLGWGLLLSTWLLIIGCSEEEVWCCFPYPCSYFDSFLFANVQRLTLFHVSHIMYLCYTTRSMPDTASQVFCLNSQILSWLIFLRPSPTAIYFSQSHHEHYHPFSRWQPSCNDTLWRKW